MLRLTLFAAMVVGAWFIAPTEQVAAESLPPTKVQQITAAGRVVDPTGKPLAGARIVLRELSSMRYSEDVYSDVDDILAETISDADGIFHFHDVPARPFRLAQGHTSPWDIVALADGYAMAWTHLQRTSTTEPIELKLAPARSISGQLTDPDGQPVADCRVELAGITSLHHSENVWRSNFGDPEQIELSRSRVGPSTKTDAAGRFELVNLPADRRLTLWLRQPRYLDGHVYVATTDAPQIDVATPSVENGKQVTVNTPVYLSGFKHQLKLGCQIHGRVIRADTQQPEPNAKVSLIAGNRAYFAKADANGEFALTAPPGAEYSLSTFSEEPGYLAVREPVELSSVDSKLEVTLALPRGETVRGQVADAEIGGGVPDVAVAYIPAGAQANVNWSPARPAKSDARGAFQIVVPPGPGELRIGGGIDRHPTHDVPDFWRWRAAGQLAEGLTTKIDVKAGQPLDDVRLTVTRGLTVRGQAVDTDGKPIALALVESVDRFARPENVRQTVTDESGHFKLAGFPPADELRLKLTDLVDRLRGTASVAADPSAGASRNVDLGRIELRGTATIVGTVLGDGKPLAGARVSLNVVTGRDGEFTHSSQDQVTTTDADGHFSLENVDSAKDSLVWISCDGFTDAGSNYLELNPGESRRLDAFQLKSRNSYVAGIVVDPDGKPVAGVTVSASQRDGGSISYGRNGPPQPTGPDGRFRIDDLPNVPLELLAYMRAPAGTNDRSIHFPARVHAEPGDSDVRILLDPKLQRPLP